MPNGTKVGVLLPDPLHRQFKSKAALEGLSLQKTLLLFAEAYTNGALSISKTTHPGGTETETLSYEGQVLFCREVEEEQ